MTKITVKLKKTVRRALVVCLLVCLQIFELNVIAKPNENVNVGNTEMQPALSFTVGEGTEENPFQIRTPEELLYMGWVVNNLANQKISENLTYATAYYSLKNDIVLNDEIFLFMPQTGTIQVLDSVGNTAHLGTGIKALDTASQFYEEASKNGATYVFDGEQYIEGIYAGELNTWTPIGSGQYGFQGHFNGNNKSIFGIYTNNMSDYQGLFGLVDVTEERNCSIQNLNIENSVIFGQDFVGGVAGALCRQTKVEDTEGRKSEDSLKAIALPRDISLVPIVPALVVQDDEVAPLPVAPSPEESHSTPRRSTPRRQTPRPTTPIRTTPGLSEWENLPPALTPTEPEEEEMPTVISTDDPLPPVPPASTGPDEPLPLASTLDEPLPPASTPPEPPPPSSTPGEALPPPATPTAPSTNATFNPPVEPSIALPTDPLNTSSTALPTTNGDPTTSLPVASAAPAMTIFLATADLPLSTIPDASLVTNNSRFNGYAIGKRYVGGLIGSGLSDNTVKMITNSMNNGIVFASATTAGYAGGILGGAGETPTVYLENCYNTGQIATNGYYCGAIAGYTPAGMDYNLKCFYIDGSAIDGEGIVQNGLGSNEKGIALEDEMGETGCFEMSDSITLGQ